MPVNWKDPDAFTRLLAAMVAAQDMKLDYRKIATMYGNGATYDSIEGRFRIIKKDAQILKSEIDTGARPEAPARGGKEPGSVVTPRKNKSGSASTTTTPRKKDGDRDRTAGGRVGKVTGGGKRGGVKREGGDGDGGSFFSVSGSVVEEEVGVGVGEGDWMGAGFGNGDGDGVGEGYFGMDEGV